MKRNQKPVIGISANLLIMEGGAFPGQERAYVNQEYVSSIVKAGGTPILLPIIENLEAIWKQVEFVDGIVISGGYDLNPLLYGEEPHPRLQNIYPERDEYELQIIKIAYELGKPILGICRGLQILNVAFGGTLYQDVSQYESKVEIQHVQKAKGYVGSHTVELIENTKLHQIFGQQFIVTNTFHHQAIKKLASGFVVNAKAQDGVIEGIEKIDSSFIMGVQWHPEMMIEKNSDMLNFFSAFIAQAKKDGENG